MAINVCFGCNETEDIKTCPKTDCFAYTERRNTIVMDDEYNKNASLVKYRGLKDLGMVAKR
jgi:hypothetical protein